MIARIDRNLAVFGGAALIMLATFVGAVAIEGTTARGLVIGVGLGAVNTVLGTYFTTRAFAGEPGAVLVTIGVGFGARFMVLIALLTTFTFVPGLGVSPAAFGFTFVVLMFIYFGIESALALRYQRREVA